MTMLLAIATLLGGVAAVGYFWEKLRGHRTDSGAAGAEHAPPPAASAPAEPSEKWVDLEYPARAGIVSAQAALGYGVRWCGDDRLATALDLEAWEKVVIPDPTTGRPVVLRLDDRPHRQTLVRKREGSQERGHNRRDR